MDNKRDDAQNELPYAGRWVARLDGRIIAHGGTPEQARKAAQRSRNKEKAEIIYMPLASPISLSPLVERVRLTLPDQELYLVGGAVRDAFLGKVSHDLDFAVPQGAIAIARQIANALKADFYILDESFDTARVIVKADQRPEAAQDEISSRQSRLVRDFLDFSSFRMPAGITGKQPATLENDLRGRDFTINSMAYDLRAGSILDPTGGASDLRSKVIRAASASAMEDDAIRILRGVRLAAALEFKIDPSTRKAMKAAARLLPEISAERQRDELFKILDGPRPDASLRALEMLGVFPYFMPELAAMKGVEQSAPHVANVWEHTLSVMSYLDGILEALDIDPHSDSSDLFTGLLTLRLGRYRGRFADHFESRLNPDRSLRALLFLAALYHDVSKPATRTLDETGRTRFLGHDSQGAERVASRGRAFNLSNDEVARLQTIIANHMRFHFHVNRLEAEGRQPSRRAIYRFFRDTGEAGVDLMLLGLADLRGTRQHLLTQQTWNSALEVARIFLENYWERPEESVAPSRFVDGNELMMELGLKPGPVVGQLLEAIREAQATGEVSNRDQALAFAKTWLMAKKNPL
jgi:tRNA nucleotidyltransferase/poly(A) polymerase